MNKQNQNEESDEGGSPENTRAPSPEDAKPAAGGSRLPSGFAVFTTFPHLLFIFEFAFGGLVWILIFLSHLPNPLALGWVLFVSVSCFTATTLLTFVYVFHGHKCDDFCITVDAAYHCIATLFYLSASVIEATIIIQNQGKIKQKQYSENIAAVAFVGLVWILILSTLVPIPLIQGWVLFVSVSCFTATTLLTFVYVFHGHKCDDFCITVDTAYHCIATLFYFYASVLEALVTLQMQEDNMYKHYSENISAVVFSFVVTLLYMIHAMFSLIRWKST